jgi:hypothetical protein
MFKIREKGLIKCIDKYMFWVPTFVEIISGNISPCRCTEHLYNII